MALITFIWARLTWPRLAARQAAPWSRKMSATSRAGRATVPADYAAGPSVPVGGTSRSSGLITVLDADQHALAIDIANAQHHHLADAQARAVGDAQRRLVLEARTGRRFEKAADFLR
jgi:hypothetical protein